ncbi:HSP20-like chaperone [Aspergillus keveii]|uniref:HSP20-like chaperone n=1 Tax=Aspergillus keveii TaxID=714993 RepID=A0ABR4G9W1_9EURO
MAFFPRYCQGDFAPLFQLLDDYDLHQSTRRPTKKTTPIKTFAPKFDVYELNDRYYLDGELPGVEQNNIEIEFSDPQTLVIKGLSERNYHQQHRSKEEELPDADDRSETSSKKQTPKKTPTPAYKFWATERSVGEFHRTFTFPTRVDQDSVKASLTNGILSVVLPKEPTPQLKKIRVE